MKKKKILLHICCAPCSIYPIKVLNENNYEVFGFWFNPNIHPFLEYEKRYKEVKNYMQNNNIKLLEKNEYNLEEFLRNVTFRESQRCRYCYSERLKYAAIYARNGKFDYFTTTLLYSKFQNHELIKEIGINHAKENGVKFLYKDFREGWKYGINKSKELKMYRQQYCGCIYSERDRYLKN
ncbi:MAG: epoxyqueuosine reductase QueH [Candidatus Mcinerneyibacterium aminivorans]|uniref:Epoxyqueuosine reductase QueH n=1 Tax=Candidatus Mcinerneyibacterium aminivorans TaxID=2703815 RepID=A0A5D0MEF2_9BACT|nr:MAG: epoxyqueuosine reductase QueH [Candidatus Mcinerneyibacterium aminivorans]